MSKVKIRHQNDAKKSKELELLLDNILSGEINTDDIEDILQGDANIFWLNNLMMSVQFFENYERDIKLLRENWFTEFSLDSHNKKCFYADSLFRLSGASVRFSPRHGVNKNLESPLHPFRVYVSSDNVEAAFDPSALGHNDLKVWPEYQFTVRMDEKSEKTGCVSLIEYKTIHEPNRGKSRMNPYAFESNQQKLRSSIYIQNKSNFDSRRLTKTEMSIAFLNKDMKRLGQRNSVMFNPTFDGTIPVNGYYKFENVEKQLKPKMIYDLKMNSLLENSHEIPELCFQNEELRNIFRRAELNSCFITQKVLNSAAYKGYFCDLLIEKLARSLHLDYGAVDESMIIEEFFVVNQNGAQHCIAPAIKIQDWNKFVAVKRFQNEEVLWPSKYMQKIMKLLPCCAVPTWHASVSKENLDYEKYWKLVFPQTEEFLLLHMMHAQIRCYFFVLLTYKSFIEPEINSASFGPKHLMHLLFWKVHKNFLAWPEDRPAENFLNFLQTLYKKLQNKYLQDFFITSRNLFAKSLPRDLHKAQSLIRKIIENPVPYIIRAISHLNLQEDFYPTFNYSQLYKTLTALPAPEKVKRTITQEKKRKVRFQDEERLWKKDIHKQMKLEKKEAAAKLSINSVNLNEMLNSNSDDWEKYTKTLQIFASHFLQMGSKSIEYNCLPQGLMYLYQTQKLLQLMAARGMTQENLKETQEQISQLQRSFCSKIKEDFRRSPEELKKLLASSEEQEKSLEKSKTWEQYAELETCPEVLEQIEELDENSIIVDSQSSYEDVTIRTKF